MMTWNGMLYRASIVGTRLGVLLCALLVSPLAARADDDEKPTPMDPQLAAAQNRTMGIIALVICLAIGWYYLRRWQATRSGNRVYGDNRNQD